MIELAQEQDIRLRESLAEFGAGKTIEFLGKALNKKK